MKCKNNFIFELITVLVLKILLVQISIKTLKIRNENKTIFAKEMLDLFNEEKMKRFNLSSIVDFRKDKDILKKLENKTNNAKRNRDIELDSECDSTNSLNTKYATTLNDSKEKIYQGSIIFNLPTDKNYSIDNFNLKVVNNFMISNSSIIQYLNGGNIMNGNNTTAYPNVDTLKINNIDENKLKVIEQEYMNKLSNLTSTYEDKMKLLGELNKKDETKLLEYEDKIKNLSENQDKEMDFLKNELDTQLKQIQENNENKLKIIKQKDEEIEKLKITLINSQNNTTYINTSIVLNDTSSLNEHKIIVSNGPLLSSNISNTITYQNYSELQNDNTNNLNNINKQNEQDNKYKENTPSNDNSTNDKYNLQNISVNFNNKNIPEKQESIKSESNIENLYPVEYVKIKESTSVENITDKEAIFNNRPNIENLPCIDVNSIEFHHFLMNIEKCRNLNNLYLKIESKLNVNSKNFAEPDCSGYDCFLEILIKFKTDNTEISLIQNKNNKLVLLYSIFISPSIYQITLNNRSIEQMEKDELKDLLVVYLYKPLTQILRNLPNYSQYSIVIVAEGNYYDKMDDELKSKFIKSLLSMQNIDDRFLIDWNNIRIINSNEKKFQDYLLLKESLGKFGVEKGVMSLDMDQNGINLIGVDNSDYQKNSNNYNNIDNILNPNQDTSKTSIQIQSGDLKENLYQKNLDVMGISSIEDTFLNEINKNTRNYNSYYMDDNPSLKGVSKLSGDSDENLNFIQLNLEKSKHNRIPKSSVLPLYQFKTFHNDPTILKLKNYLSDNSIIDDYFMEKTNKFKKVRGYEDDKYSSSQFRFKAKGRNRILNNTFIENSCFNKGYYNKKLNLVGSGDYYKCYNYIQNNFYNSSISDSKRINKNIKNSKVILGKEFELFKFLFYNQTQEKNILKYCEEEKYPIIKSKIIDICSKQFSFIIAEYSKFHISNFAKLCFDLTYFTLILDSNGIDDKFTLILETELNNRSYNGLLFNIFTKPNNLFVAVTFIISTFISILLFIINEKLAMFVSKLITKTNSKLYCHLIPSNEEIEEYISYYRVKCYLFYEDDSHFKTKYGKDYDHENQEKTSIIEELKELYTQKEELRSIILECKIYFQELKISICIYLIHICFLLYMIITFCILLHDIQLEFGIVKTITTMLAIVFIVVVMAIFFKISFKYQTYSNKGHVVNEIAGDI